MKESMHLSSFSPPSVPLSSPCRHTLKGCFYGNVKNKLTNRKLRQFLKLDTFPFPPQIRDLKLYSCMPTWFTWRTPSWGSDFLSFTCSISVTITHSLSWCGLLWFQVETLHTMHTVPSTVGPCYFLMDTVVTQIVNSCEITYFLCNQFDFIVF